MRETLSNQRYDGGMRYVALIFLSACGPRVLSTTPRSVTVDGVNESTLGKATAMAQSECTKHGRDAELASTDDVARGMNSKAVTFKCVDRTTPAAPVATDASSPSQPRERKVAYGRTPLYCASTTPDVGECWLDQDSCVAAIAALGIPGCERKLSGSCFNATKQLDGTKSTVCAVSIKDCETRRETFAKNPDYKVTGCGIYRAEER